MWGAPICGPQCLREVAPSLAALLGGQSIRIRTAQALLLVLSLCHARHSAARYPGPGHRHCAGGSEGSSVMHRSRAEWPGGLPETNSNMS